MLLARPIAAVRASPRTAHAHHPHTTPRLPPRPALARPRPTPVRVSTLTPALPPRQNVGADVASPRARLASLVATLCRGVAAAALVAVMVSC